jgi:hypothetical protein
MLGYGAMEGVSEEMITRKLLLPQMRKLTAMLHMMINITMNGTIGSTQETTYEHPHYLSIKHKPISSYIPIPAVTSVVERRTCWTPLVVT